MGHEDSRLVLKEVRARLLRADGTLPSPSSITYWRLLGKLHPTKVGDRWLYDPREVEALRREREKAR